MKIGQCLLFSFSGNLLKQMPSNLKGKNVTSQMWLKRQLNDPYVLKTKTHSYRCRSAFKLTEIDDKYHILKPGQVVIDCGAAPGSWSQICVERTNSHGKDAEHKQGTVIGIDLQEIQPLPGATLLSNRDITSKETMQEILNMLQDRKIDVVLSDMAPKATGVKNMDHEIIIDLCMKTLVFSWTVLAEGGTFLCKIWNGGQEKNLINTLKLGFQKVQVVKPLASRKDSAEAFILARNFKNDLNLNNIS